MKNIILYLTLALLFIACGEDDPCEGIVCGDNGICVNGGCDCDEGYTGLACNDIITPTRMTITQLRLTNFPELKSSGEFWDITGGNAPDIFFTIGRDGNTPFTSSTISDASGLITWGDPVDLVAPTEQYSITFLDSDVIVDDLISGGTFVPFQDRLDETLFVDNGIISFEMDIEYTF